MDKKSLVNSIQVEERLIDAIQAIKENQNRCIIVKSKEKVVGVISEGDILRALLQGVDIHSPMQNWISHDFKFLSSLDYQQALDLMSKHGISMIPILDKNFLLLDVITLVDLLQRVILKKN